MVAGPVISNTVPLRRVRYDARYISSYAKCCPGMF